MMCIRKTSIAIERIIEHDIEHTAQRHACAYTDVRNLQNLSEHTLQNITRIQRQACALYTIQYIEYCNVLNKDYCRDKACRQNWELMFCGFCSFQFPILPTGVLVVAKLILGLNHRVITVQWYKEQSSQVVQHFLPWCGPCASMMIGIRGGRISNLQRQNKDRRRRVIGRIRTYNLQNGQAILKK